MAIRLDNKTKLTTEVEKLFVELGDQDPHKTLTDTELTTALTQAIETLAERHSPILENIYRQYELAGKVPPLEE